MTVEAATSDVNASPNPKPKRRRLRRWLIGVVAVALGCWLVMFALWLQGPAKGDADQPPPIPKPNGYDDLLEAYKMLKDKMPVVKGSFPDYAKFETPALKDFIAKIQEPLAQIREGLDRPFQVPYVYDLNVFTTTTMSEVGQIRGFVNRALQVEGQLARREQRLADAARSALDLIRVGNALGREVPMVVYLSSLPSIYLGAAALRDMRAELVDNPKLCRETIAEMVRLDRDRPTVDRAAQRESAFMNINVRNYGMVASAMFRVSGVMAKQKAQALDSLRESSNRNEAMRRLVLADLAIRLYQKENQGTPPPSLDALVPAILLAVPIDPFTDKPLIYRVVKDGYELYSTGPDRDDDKLDPILKSLGRNDTDGDATVDSF
jgi:hypothetical protein